MIQSMEIPIGRLKTTVKSCFKNIPDASLFITGPTGVGKSQILRQLAEEMGSDLIDVRLAGLLPEDLRGIPNLDASAGFFSLVMMDQLKPAFDKNADCILLLDEINQADREVLSAVFQLVYDRALNGKSLGKKVRVVAAGNIGDIYNVTDMSPALERRFVHIKTRVDKPAWLKYMAERPNTYYPLVEFIEKRKDEVLSVVTDEVILSPAQWTLASDYLENAEKEGSLENDLDIHMTVVSGIVGASLSRELFSFIKSSRNVTPTDLIHKNWKSLEKKVRGLVEGSRHSILSELCEGVASYLAGRGSDLCENETTLYNVGQFLLILPAELSTKLVKQLWAQAPAVLTAMDAETLMAIQEKNSTVMTDVK